MYPWCNDHDHERATTTTTWTWTWVLDDNVICMSEVIGDTREEISFDVES